jgi:membrane protein
MQRKSIWQFLKTTINEWVEAEPFQLAAALSYYTLFSLAPLLLIAIGVAGFVFGREAAQNQIVETLQGMIGQDSAQTVQEMIQASNEKPKTGMMSTLIGFVALMFGAGGVVGQLQTSLNRIWEVKPKPGQGIWGFLRQRFFSFAMVLAIGFLLLVSLVVTQHSSLMRSIYWYPSDLSRYYLL